MACCVIFWHIGPNDAAARFYYRVVVGNESVCLRKNGSVAGFNGGGDNHDLDFASADGSENRLASAAPVELRYCCRRGDSAGDAQPFLCVAWGVWADVLLCHYAQYFAGSRCRGTGRVVAAEMGCFS